MSMRFQPDPSPNKQLECPARLRQDLHALYGVEAAPSGDVDERMHQAIVEHFEASRSRGLRTRRMRPMWAAAALLALLAGIAILTLRTPSPPPTQNLQAAAKTTDVNGDGHVDILDALALALMLQSTPAPAGEQIDHKFDFNRDRSIDQRDVDVIAMEAVSLGAGASS